MVQHLVNKSYDGILVEHPSCPELSLSLWNVANRTGLRTAIVDGKEELVIDAAHVNEYLLVATLAKRIAYGDILLVDNKDNCGKREYMEHLIAGIRKSLSLQTDDVESPYES